MPAQPLVKRRPRRRGFALLLRQIRVIASTNSADTDTRRNVEAPAKNGEGQTGVGQTVWRESSVFDKDIPPDPD